MGKFVKVTVPDLMLKFRKRAEGEDDVILSTF